MRKFLLTSVVFFGVSTLAIAQTTPVRLEMMGETADIEVKSLGETKSSFEITNPHGTEKVTLDLENTSPDSGHAVAKDSRTGKIISEAYVKKDEYIRMQHDLPNQKVNINMRRTGIQEDNLSGTLQYKSQDESMDLQVNNGKVTGTIKQVENGYEHLVKMYANGMIKALIIDPKTRKTLFTAEGTEDSMKLYDSNKKLIAEGSEDNMKVYDQKAYQQYVSITDSDE